MWFYSYLPTVYHAATVFQEFPGQLQRLLDDTVLRSSLVANARTYVMEHHSCETERRSWHHLVDKLQVQRSNKGRQGQGYIFENENNPKADTVLPVA